ncbi:MAG: DUF6314 family protein [Pseudomonadota bacterium]
MEKIHKPVTDNLFVFFIGEWSLLREIDPHGSFEGTATFTPINDNTLQYEEQGVLQLKEGHTLDDVTKRYLYKFEDEVLFIYFDDGPDKGRLFHQLEFDDQGLATATHDCPPDVYQTKMHLKSSDAFKIIHDVKGPRKDYKITSFYRKI